MVTKLVTVTQTTQSYHGYKLRTQSTPVTMVRNFVTDIQFIDGVMVTTIVTSTNSSRVT